MRRRYVLWVVAALALVALVLILWGPDRSGLHARNPTEAGSSVAGPGRGVGLGGPLAVNSIGAARAQISGRVIDGTGKGLAGASVCGSGTSVDLSDNETRDPTCAVSRADGSYLLGALYAATWEVNASAPGHAPGRYSELKRERIDLGPGESRTGVDLVLRRGGVEVRGRVKDIGGGVVPGALVTVTSMEEEREYEFGFARTTLQAGQQLDLAPIRCARRRVNAHDRGGDLGFELKDVAPSALADPVPLRVAVVRPGGPAAGAGLKVGDVITSIDGQDVTGALDYLYWTISRVPEGTRVTLGLARGTTLSITASAQP